jgi:hypothetical protein
MFTFFAYIPWYSLFRTTLGGADEMKQRSGAIRKKTAVIPELTDQPVIFCTACGATLENFCFSAGADNLEAVRKTLAQCRRQGRFSGDFCSKLFIAHPEVFDEPGGNEEDDAPSPELPL